MRGKHREASSARRAAALASAVERARAELAAEQELLAQVKSEETVLDQLRARLATVTTLREAETIDELAQLEREADLLRAETLRAEAASQRVHELWQTPSDALVELLGGGAHGVELFANIVANLSGPIISNLHRKLGSVRAQQLEVARGERRFVRRDTWDRKHPPRPLHGLLHPDLDEAFDAEASDGTTPPADIVAAAEAVQRASWTTATRDCLYTWHPYPWIEGPMYAGTDHEVARRFGFTDEAAKQALPAAMTDGGMAIESFPTGALSAARRQHLARQNPGKIISAWQQHLRPGAPVEHRWPTALSTPPLHPTSADAAAVKHWYTLAALGQWAKAETVSAEHGYAAGTLAVAMAAAPVFWLPPTQTFDMLDSEPVTDLDDLRLPYPQVMLTFAEPPLLQPATDFTEMNRETDTTRRSADLIEAALLTAMRHQPRPPMELLMDFLVSETDSYTPASVWDMIALRGARVEGVLLLGDSLGRIAPQAGWAVAIPSVNGRHVAYRALIPTTWEASVWRDQLLNAAAVVAWADWHAPLPPADGDPHDPDPAPTRPNDGGADVHVLAVRRTRATSPQSGTPTGRTIAAHVRRGHWRRQHHGPRGELVKRIRIAPTVVNAGQRSFATRVYVLPASN